MLIGFVGFIGSGKGTVGEILVKKGFQKESFAKPLKDACANIFGWNRDMLEGNTDKSRKWREIPDEFWSKSFGRDFSPREALQLLGTEAGRNVFHKDIWVQSLINRVTTKKTIITDVRFRNEIEMVHNHGGKIVRVKRGPEPEWFEDAKVFKKGHKRNMGWAMAKYKLQELNIHSSEIDWINCPVDYTIENNGTLDELGKKVENMLQLFQL